MTRLSSDPECGGLVPDTVPEPVEVTMPATATGAGTLVCQAQTLSDGTGHVAIEWRDGPGWAEWLVFTNDGRSAGSFSSAWAANAPGLRGPMPQPSGWLVPRPGALFAPFDASLDVRRPDGSLVRTVPISSPSGETRTFAAFADPNGGALIAIAGPSPSADRPTGCFGETWRFNASGGLVANPGDVECRVAAGGVARSGDALILSIAAPDAELAGQTIATWISPQGVPLAKGTGLEDSLVSMLPLLDGSLLAWMGDRTFVYPHLATATVAAPEWLANRTPVSWQLRFTRGNRGYALFRRGMSSTRPCDPGVELRAPSGRLCATLTFVDDSGGCAGGRADQGWDGTVIQNDSTSPCRYRWWPRLLAAP